MCANWVRWIVMGVMCLMASACQGVNIDELEARRAAAEQTVFWPDDGGDTPIIHLPFALGYASQCTQGAGGSTSHKSVSTLYDIDFDTPNDQDVTIFAPVSGIARTHVEDAHKNFGWHVNIDLGNGTYVIVAHLANIFVRDGTSVVAGQAIGVEGCTGYCTGDHVHVGLHRGNAHEPGERGTSTQVRYWVVDKTTNSSVMAMNSGQLVCGIKAFGDKVNGHFYVSQLTKDPEPSYGPTNPSSAVDAGSSAAHDAGSSSLGPDVLPTSSVDQVSTGNPVEPTSPKDDVWFNDYGLDGIQETLMLSAERWSSATAKGKNAYVWSTGGCFEGVLSPSDLVTPEYGYYRVDFSSIPFACTADLTLVSAVGTNGLMPAPDMSNWLWWQNGEFCSLGSSLCELQKNGQAWEEWMIRVHWDPVNGLSAAGNGFTKNAQLK